VKRPKKLNISVIVLLSLLIAFAAPSAQAADRYSVATGNWGSTSTWSATSGGSSGASVPVAGDNVYIERTYTVTIAANAACANITIGTANGAGTLTFKGASSTSYTLTVSGNISIASNGSFTVTNVTSYNYQHTLNIGGNLTVNGTFNMTTANDDGAATVFNGSSQQTISGSGTTCTFEVLTISNTNSTGVVLGRNIVLATSTQATTNSNLTISANDVFDLSSYTADRASGGSGTLTVNAGATLKIGGTGTFPANYTTNTLNASSTVIYNGTTQTVGAQTYGNLTLSGSGVETLAGTTSIVGNLTVSAGTFDLSSYSANRSSAGGTLTVSNGASLKIGGTGTIPSNYSTHSIGSTSTIEYAGTNQSVAVLNSSQNYGNLTISGSGTKTLAGAETVSGTLTISAGTLADGGYTLSVNGNIANSASHTGAGKISLTGGSTTHTLSGAGSYTNLELNDANGATLSSSIPINGNLTLTSGTFDLGSYTANRATAGGTLTVSSGATLKIGGTGTLPSNYSTHSIGATSTINYYGTTQSVATLNSSQNYGNLTISGSGTATLAGAVGVAGNLAISSGTFDLSSYTANRTAAGGTLTVSNGATLSIGGTGTLPSNYSTHSIDATSTINYYGSTQTVATLNSSQNYGNLTISGSGTKTLAGTVGIAGNLSLSAGTLDLGSYTANRTSVGGTLTVSNGTTLLIGGTGTLPSNYSTHSIGATSTINYYGTTQTVAALNSSQNYGYLTISGSGTKTLAGNENVAGDLTISAGTFDLGSYTIDRASAGGTLTLSNGATLMIGGTGTFPANYSTHSIGATSTINYYGTTQTVATLNSSQNYGYLTISGSGTRTLAGNVGVVNDLTISGGIFDLGTNTCNRTAAGGTFSVSTGATLKAGGSSGGITGSNFPINYSTNTLSGTVEYSGTGAQTIPVLNYTGLAFSNVGTKSISSSITATGTVTINSGAPVSVASGVTLQVKGSMSNAGTLTNSGTILLQP
jgi:hypothetical protein